MRRFLILVPFLLAACGGGDPSTTVRENVKTYSDHLCSRNDFCNPGAMYTYNDCIRDFEASLCEAGNCDTSSNADQTRFNECLAIVDTYPCSAAEYVTPDQCGEVLL